MLLVNLIVSTNVTAWNNIGWNYYAQLSFTNTSHINEPIILNLADIVTLCYGDCDDQYEDIRVLDYNTQQFLPFEFLNDSYEHPALEGQGTKIQFIVPDASHIIKVYYGNKNADLLPEANSTVFYYTYPFDTTLGDLGGSIFDLDSSQYINDGNGINSAKTNGGISLAIDKISGRYVSAYIRDGGNDIGYHGSHVFYYTLYNNNPFAQVHRSDYYRDFGLGTQYDVFMLVTDTYVFPYSTINVSPERWIPTKMFIDFVGINGTPYNITDFNYDSCVANGSISDCYPYFGAETCDASGIEIWCSYVQSDWGSYGCGTFPLYCTEYIIIPPKTYNSRYYVDNNFYGDANMSSIYPANTQLGFVYTDGPTNVWLDNLRSSDYDFNQYLDPNIPTLSQHITGNLTFRYNNTIKIVNTGSIGYNNTPIYVNVTAAECYYSDKRDLRVEDYYTLAEIPYTLSGTYGEPFTELRFIANVPANVSNYPLAIVYCGRSDLEKPRYSGIVVNAVANMGINDEFGDTGNPLDEPYLNLTLSDGTNFVLYNGQLSLASVNGDLDLGSYSNFLNTIWRDSAGGWLYAIRGLTDVECQFNSNQSTYNNSQWLDIFCWSPTGAITANTVFMNFNFWDNNKMINIYTGSGEQLGLGTYTGAKAGLLTSSPVNYPSGSMTFKYADSPTTISALTGGTYYVDVYRGLFVNYPDDSTYGFGSVWFSDFVDSKRIYTELSLGYPYSSMFCDTGQCETGGLYNFSTDNLYNFWIGFLPKTDIGMEDVYEEKMNPVYASLGCEPIFECTHYLGCNNTYNYCDAAVDVSVCNVTYTGDFSEFTQRCQTIIPYNELNPWLNTSWTKRNMLNITNPTGDTYQAVLYVNPNRFNCSYSDWRDLRLYDLSGAKQKVSFEEDGLYLSFSVPAYYTGLYGYAYCGNPAADVENVSCPECTYPAYEQTLVDMIDIDLSWFVENYSTACTPIEGNICLEHSFCGMNYYVNTTSPVQVCTAVNDLVNCTPMFKRNLAYGRVDPLAPDYIERNVYNTHWDTLDPMSCVLGSSGALITNANGTTRITSIPPGGNLSGTPLVNVLFTDISIIGTSDLSSYITFGDNSIYIDTSVAPQFSSPALITINNVPFPDPNIYRNYGSGWVLCSYSQCYNRNYVFNSTLGTGTMTFNVNGFSGFLVGVIEDVASGINGIQVLVFAAFGLMAIILLVAAAFLIVNMFREGGVDTVTMIGFIVTMIGLAIVLLIGYIVISSVSHALIG